MALSDTAIRRIRPGTKPIKITDEKGLYLLVTPSGGKWWRLDYLGSWVNEKPYPWAFILI